MGGLFPFYQNNVTPSIAVDGVDILQNNTNDLLLNRWSVISLTSTNIQGTCRIDLNNNFISGRLSGIGTIGICLGIDSIGSFFNANFEIAYIIMRNVADGLIAQNNIINWLKNRFAI